MKYVLFNFLVIDICVLIVKLYKFLNNDFNKKKKSKIKVLYIFFQFELNWVNVIVIYNMNVFCVFFKCEILIILNNLRKKV